MVNICFFLDSQGISKSYYSLIYYTSTKTPVYVRKDMNSGTGM